MSLLSALLLSSAAISLSIMYYNDDPFPVYKMNAVFDLVLGMPQAKLS